LLERLDPTLTPNEARSVWNSIRMELTAAWQTEELPRERLTVADEREQILFYLVEILYRVVPAFYEEIAQALEKLYGTDAGAARPHALPRVPRAARGAPAQHLRGPGERLRECAAVPRRRVADRHEPESQQRRERRPVLRRASAAPDRRLRISPGDARRARA